jgi:hypothetical protein
LLLITLMTLCPLLEPVIYGSLSTVKTLINPHWAFEVDHCPPHQLKDRGDGGKGGGLPGHPRG